VLLVLVAVAPGAWSVERERREEEDGYGRWTPRVSVPHQHLISDRDPFGLF